MPSPPSCMRNPRGRVTPTALDTHAVTPQGWSHAHPTALDMRCNLKRLVTCPFLVLSVREAEACWLVVGGMVCGHLLWKRCACPWHWLAQMVESL